MKPTVGLVGLGAMGLPMGRRLLSQGYPLVVVPHSRPEPAAELVGLGAREAGTAAELGGLCDLVLTSVPDAPQVEEVLFGAHGLALADAPRPGLIHIDMSTIAPSAARDFSSRLAAVGIGALDAPVSGGPSRAGEGTLTIMVGGDSEVYERALPVLQALGNNVLHVGAAGQGQVVKLTNQLMISIIMVANAEALALGVKSGVPLDTLLRVIGTSSGSNYLMQSWLPRTLFTGDLSGGFALDLLMKDLNLALQSARELGVPTFGGALAQQLYALARSENGGRPDYSVVARIYEEAGGVQLQL